MSASSEPVAIERRSEIYAPLSTDFEADELPIGLLQAILVNQKSSETYSEYFEQYPYMYAGKAVFNDEDIQFTFGIKDLLAVNEILLKTELSNLQHHFTKLIGLNTPNHKSQYPNTVEPHGVQVSGGKQRKQRGGNAFLKSLLCYKRKSNIVAPAPSTPVTQFSSIQQVNQRPVPAAQTRTIYVDETIPIVVTSAEYERLFEDTFERFRLTTVSTDSDQQVAIVKFTATEVILKMLDEKFVELWESYTKDKLAEITTAVTTLPESDKSPENINAKIKQNVFKAVYKMHQIPDIHHNMLLKRQVALNHLAIADPGEEGQTPHFKIKDYYRLTATEAEFKDSDFWMTIEILFALLEHGYVLHRDEPSDGQVGNLSKEMLELIAEGKHEICKVFDGGEAVRKRLEAFPEITKTIVFYMDEPLLLKVEEALNNSWFFVSAQVPYHINGTPYFLTLVKNNRRVDQLHTLRSLVPKDFEWRENLIIMYDIKSAEVFTKQERTPLIKYNGVTTYLRPIYRGGRNHFRISLIDDFIMKGHRITSKHFALLNKTLKKCFTVGLTAQEEFGGIIRPFNGARSDGGSRLKSRSRRTRNNVTKVIIS